MRIFIDILIALMIAGILAGAVVLHRSNQEKQLNIETTRVEVRRFQRQLMLKAAIAQAGNSNERFPDTVDPTWFGENLPKNYLLNEGHPWVEIAAKSERTLAHPIDPTANEMTDAQFWYNPYLGLVRARVPADVSDAKAVELYNTINETDLVDLFSRSPN